MSFALKLKLLKMTLDLISAQCVHCGQSTDRLCDKCDTSSCRLRACDRLDQETTNCDHHACVRRVKPLIVRGNTPSTHAHERTFPDQPDPESGRRNPA
ncbi:hypothetical protein BaRGS_00031725 [Batillaria attramentaria]|uniref:Uncharacterized protein n=1 Tax=Batillaria attramentaria TaxID=370345 RepID=A0ABD0JQS1_9CAEN